MKEPQQHENHDLAHDLYTFVRTRILADGVDFSMETSLESVGIDSVSLLEILLYLERQHDIYIADEMLTPENIATLSNLAKTAWISGRKQ